MIVRNGRSSDKERLKAIWKERFGDEDSYIDWFFNERFCPKHCSITELDGEIVSSLYSFPVKIKVRNTCEKGILISGVSTLPEYEGNGYMRQTMMYHLKRMRNAGYNISLLKAVNPEIYYSLEHRLINDVQIVNSIDLVYASENVKYINIIDNIDKLYECFIKYSEKYSGSVLRTRKDFISKCNEYDKTGGKCLALFKNKDIIGYCVFFLNNDELFCEECLALSDSVYNDFFSYISSLPYDSKKVRVACDVNIDSINKSEKLFGNSAYSMNVSHLLSVTGLKGYAIEIIDSVINDNNGIFSLSGEKINAVPSLKISNGHLTQWIFGFKSIKELIKEGMAVVLEDNGIVEYMDSIGKCMTYVIDEY